MQKHMLVLAKSFKAGDFCVAGLEVGNSVNGHQVLKRNWLRPVSANSSDECIGPIPKGACDNFRVGDVVQLDLVAPRPIIAQPENWLWRESNIRLTRSSVNPQVLRPFADTAEPIWFDPATKRDDQISASYAKSQEIDSSLMLVAPQNLVFTLELSQMATGTRKRIFASFVHKGQAFQRIAVTDPAVCAVFCNQFPSVPGAWVQKTLNHNDNYWLTLSLSPAFGTPAHHYVLVAAVIDHTGYLNRKYG